MSGLFEAIVPRWLSPAHDAGGVLFVSQSGNLGGAEFILLDVVRGFGPRASAFLFEEGPLQARLIARGLPVGVSRHAGRLGTIKRDRNLGVALPQVGRLAMTVAEITRLSKRHELVYANSQKAFALAAPAAFLARRPLIWHLHDILCPAHFSATQRRVAVALANRFATRVIVPSGVARAAFVAEGGRPSLISVVPNGLDVTPEPASISKLRAALHLPEGFLFGVFSRLSPWKGQHVAIEALALLPGAHCVIAGAALFGEDSYALELHAMAQRLGVADRVLFLGYRSDIARLMRAVDVVVHPSVDPEPFGRTLVEAMLCRVPVIASRNGAAPEILEEGRAGILVLPGQPQAFAAALRAIMTNARSTITMVDYAEDRALRLYGSARMVASIRDVLAPLARNRHDRS